MNYHSSTKSMLLLSCVCVCFFRGLFLSFIEENSNINVIIQLTFAGVVLYLFRSWFTLDAQEHLSEAELSTWRYNFIRDALLYPMYFRRTRGAEALAPMLWCTGFIVLCYFVIVGGGMVGIVFNLGK